MDRDYFDRFSTEQLREQARKYRLVLFEDRDTLINTLMSHLKRHSPAFDWLTSRLAQQAQDSSFRTFWERCGKKWQLTLALHSSDSRDRSSENLLQDFSSVMLQQMQFMQQQQQQALLQRQQKYQQQQIKQTKLKQMQLRRQGTQRRLSQVAPCLQGPQTQQSSISLTSLSPDAYDIHRSTSRMDIDSSECSQEKGYLVTLPSFPRVEHENSLSESVAYLRKTISDPVNAIVQHQVKGNTAKMLVMLATGKQRLVAFDIPNEDCTVHDLLEQMHITFCNDTTVSLVDDSALGVNYIVQAGSTALGSSYNITDHSDGNSSREIMSSSTEKNVDDQHTREYLQNDNQKVSINMLNDDCLRHIFEFLPILDKIRVERVCRRWKAISLESWHTVRVLDFSSSEWRSINRRSIRDSVFYKLLRCGRFLTQLRLSNVYISLPDDILNNVGQFCPNLTNVNFNEIESTASSIDALAKNCKNISRLAIGESLHNLDNELSNLFIHNNLEYLEINNNKLSGKCLTSLSAESLRTLILYKCNYICEDYFCKALKRLGGLEKLVINIYADVDQCILENINQYCINLKVLDLNDSFDIVFDIDRSLNFINLVKLEKIRITYIYEILDVEIANMVRNCRELIDVDITGCNNVTDDGLASIATLAKLERLNISHIYGITDDGLRHFRDLKVLECRSCNITAEGLSVVLRSSPELRLLDISDCLNVDKHILKVAEEVCNRRASNVILKMIVEGSSVYPVRYFPSYFLTAYDNYSSDIEMSPFLQIVNEVDDLYDPNYRSF